MIVLVVAEGVAVLLLGLLVAGLLRSHAEILRALHRLGADLDPASTAAGTASSRPGLVDVPFGVVGGVVGPPVGDAAGASGRAAHDLAGTLPGGDAVAVGVLDGPQHTLLAFLSSGCTTCQSFWRDLGGTVDLPAGVRLVAVTKGPDEESESAVARLAPAGLPLVMSTRAYADYQVPGSPYFVLVDGPAGRVVGEGAATGWKQVRSLLGEALGDAGLRTGRTGGGLTAATGGSGAVREARADADLAAAGIRPGDASLWPAGPADTGPADTTRTPAANTPTARTPA